MSFQTSEAILLRAVPFRDFDEILTFLTPVGKISAVKKGQQNRISPLTHVEITYFVGRSDLYSCKSLSVLNPFLSLRKNLVVLEAACEMVKAAGSVSMPGQECKDLFHSLVKALETVGAAKDPLSYVSWFYLYVLGIEGLIPPEKLDFYQFTHQASEFKTIHQIEIKKLFNLLT